MLRAASCPVRHGAALVAAQRLSAVQRPQASRAPRTTCQAASKSKVKKQQSAGKGFSATSSGSAPSTSPSSGNAKRESDAQPLAPPQPDAASPPQPTKDQLPRVSRGRVFQSCATISGAVFVVGLLLRQAAPYISSVLGADPAAVKSLLAGPQLSDTGHLAVVAATAAAVTGGRLALLAVWPDFAAATDRSNRQVLTPLAWYDLLWVAALPGISEELLFRGALIPALSPDWRGVVISGVAFGVLHNSGGRNWAFAGWAAVVGSLYGAAYLATGDIAVPVGAHVLANLSGAVLWLQFRKGDKAT